MEAPRKDAATACPRTFNAAMTMLRSPTGSRLAKSQTSAMNASDGSAMAGAVRGGGERRCDEGGGQAARSCKPGRKEGARSSIDGTARPVGEEGAARRLSRRWSSREAAAPGQKRRPANREQANGGRREGENPPAAESCLTASAKQGKDEAGERREGPTEQKAHAAGSCSETRAEDGSGRSRRQGDVGGSYR